MESPRDRSRLAWLVVALALLEGGWLAFDGGHALVVGDYVTPSSGPHAGQLGPWSNVVEALGIDPRSTLMKGLHCLLGGTWLGATVCYVLRLRGARTAMVTCAVLGLWYLPFGTLLGTLQLILLHLPPLREEAR